MRFDGSTSPVEDIKTGDQLMGPDSKPRNVLGINRGVGALYHVRQKSAEDYIVNDAHILALKRSKSSREDYGDFSKAGNPQRKNGRYARYGVDTTLINAAEYHTKPERFKNHVFGYKVEVDFPDQRVPIDPYLLGMWLGDGDSARVAFTNMDEEVLGYLREYAKERGINVHDTQKPNQRARRLIFSNQWKREGSIRSIFRDANLLFNKHIPEEYIINSKEVRLQLLAGLIDSDGYIGNGLSITQKSSKLIKGIKRLADSLGFKTSLRPIVATCNGKKFDVFGLSIGGDINRIPCLIKRKKDKLHSQKHRNWRHTRVDVEPIGDGEYFGFELDGDHLFLLSDGTVTHNSHFFAESLIELCLMVPGARIVCVREVQRALKESVKRLLEDKITEMGLGGYFTILFDTIVTPGNGVILFQGMADHTAESIKSLEGFDVAYVEEAQTLTARSLELLRPTIRGSSRMRKLGRKSEIWFSWNPRSSSDPVDSFLRGANPPKDSIVVRTSYKENLFLPEESEEEREYDEIHNPQRYAHIWEGEYEPQAMGAIWTRDVIERNRKEKAPEMGRILIGVDPPGESNKSSDKCGLIAAGIGDKDGRGYVLQDESIQATPEEWGRAAVAMYDLHDADAIVAEVNQGGDMVRSVIHAVRQDIKVIKVRAKRGKHIRAEPVSALYALNKVSHIGNFPDLERQMCLTTADGYQGNDSPDNMDACVYIFLELFNKMIKDKPSTANRPVRASNKYRPHRWRESGR